MTEASILLNRAYDDSTANPDKFGTPLVLGEIGFLTYATSANPTAEVLSSTTDSTAGHVFSANALDTTLSLTAGTITLPRGGLYEVVLELVNVTAASNNGVITFELQLAAANLTNRKQLLWTNAAAVLPGLAGRASARITVTAGQAVRAVVTGSTGGVITIGGGALWARQIADTAPMNYTRV